MASLVLSTVGAAVGGAIAGPLGAMVGRLAGSVGGALIDQSLFGGREAAAGREGPRLADLEVMASTEGAPIPRAYGSVRLAGQMIWATRLEEAVTVRESGAGGGGGKGGEDTSTSGTTETSYSYYGNFAIGLCEGPIAGIGRLWADGKPLDPAGIALRVHRGEETQAPDPLIEAKQGAGAAPAYRGLAYLVFERLPLARFGNRIPQIQAEIHRPIGRLETMIRAMTLIPGATEFGYDTLPVDRVTGPGSYRTENRHAPIAGTDFELSLDRLIALCPRLERVSLVVSWFGTDLRAGHCRIEPRVDLVGKETAGAVWSVAGLPRESATAVSQVDGRAAFGGTPSDGSVVRALQAIKARGLKAVLYPFVMMDIPAGNGLPDPWTGAASQPTYPWRGRITCDPAPDRAGSPDGYAAAGAQVAALFGTAAPADFAVVDGAVTYSGPAEWTLRRMVLHCAHLAVAAGGVDALFIGSEFEALTRVRSAPGVYPAVDQLVALAADVKAVVGGATKVSYAANWSEYGAHVRNDGAEVRFPLDPLWASSAVDLVAIDWYPPLADWRDSDHLDAQTWRSTHARGYLAGNVRGGEAFDWYYADETDRGAQTRTAIADPVVGKPWVFRQKDLAGWWGNTHYERLGGHELPFATAWVPQSKPIWLSELGVPAVDKGANRPSCFPDPKSVEGTLPPFSDGRRDDAIQRRALEVTLAAYDDEFGASTATNPVSSVYGGAMVDPAGTHLWTWDARPYPWFPRDTAEWSDGPNWETGHWLTGRLGSAPLDALVETIAAESGVAVDTSELTGSLDGYVLDRPMSARAALEPLTAAFAVAAVEAGDRIAFRPRGGRPVATLTDDDLVVAGEDAPNIRLVRTQESELPLEVTLGYTDAEADYRRAVARSRRLVGASRRVAHADLAAVTHDGEATRLAEVWLQDLWAGREEAAFALPPSRLALQPGDVVRLVHRGRERLVELREVVDEGALKVAGRSIDPEVFAVPMRAPRTRRPQRAPAINLPLVHVLDLPLLAGEDPPVLQHVAVFADPWPGSMTLWRSTDGSGYEVAGSARIPAIVGKTLDALPAGPLWRWDRANAVRVELAGGALASLPDAAVLDGANAAAVRRADGAWEVLQFATAELVGTRTWRLSRLLRGQRGSEWAMAAPLPAGSVFVMLDAALVPIARGESEVGRTLRWRVGPAGRDHADRAVLSLTATAGATALKPYAPVRVRGRRTAEGVALTWIRRTRRGGDAFALAEVPLGEASEAYAVDILAGGAVRRTIETTTSAALYAAADELADFGAPQATLAVRVAQRGAAVGRGIATETTLTLG